MYNNMIFVQYFIPISYKIGLHFIKYHTYIWDNLGNCGDIHETYPVNLKVLI